MGNFERATESFSSSKFKTRRGKSPRREKTLSGAIVRDIPFLGAGIGADLIASEIVIRTGGIETGFGSSLIMLASNNTDPLSLPTLAFHVGEVGIASAVAYGLTFMTSKKKDKIFTINGFMLGLAGIHMALETNNLWDLAYINGNLPVPGPLDGLANLGLTALVNFLDWGWPEQPVK